MAGKWLKVWNDDLQKWQHVYFDDWPQPGTLGSVVPSQEKEQDVVIFGPDGNPIAPPPKQKVGF